MNLTTTSDSSNVLMKKKQLFNKVLAQKKLWAEIRKRVLYV